MFCYVALRLFASWDQTILFSNLPFSGLFQTKNPISFTKDTHQYFTKPSPVEVGDYIEFLAEIDLLVSASTCPQGDVSIACGDDAEPVVYPLKVEVYKLNDKEKYLTGKGWKPSPKNGYSGNHGIPSS